MPEEHFRSRAISPRYVIIGSVLLCVVAILVVWHYWGDRIVRHYWDTRTPEERAKDEGRTTASCIANICGIIETLYRYARDNGGNFPPDESTLWSILPQEAERLRCPVTRLRRSYTYVAGLREDDPRDYILLFENKGTHEPEGGIVWLCSGEVEFQVSEAELKRRLAKQRRELEKQSRKMELIPIDSSRGR